MVAFSGSGKEDLQLEACLLPTKPMDSVTIIDGTDVINCRVAVLCDIGGELMLNYHMEVQEDHPTAVYSSKLLLTLYPRPDLHFALSSDMDPSYSAIDATTGAFYSKDQTIGAALLGTFFGLMYELSLSHDY